MAISQPTSVGPSPAGMAMIEPATTAKPALRRTQAERTASTRARLIDAAIEALHKFGYAATSTTLVADRAGVSRGAMLHHFPTKVDLMAAVVQATYEADLAVYAQTQRAHKDPEERLIAIIRAAGRQFRTPGGVAQTELWNATRSDPDLAAVIGPMHEELDARSERSLKATFCELTGRDGGAMVEALNLLNLAALRGLSLESAFGTDPGRAEAATELLCQIIRNQVALLRQSGSQ